jgi:hypothetical protein
MSDTLITVIGVACGGTVFLTLLIGLVLVIRDTARGKGAFGMNFKAVSCPACGEPAPTIRAPKNFRQAMLGGCTCPKCGAEYDKWGQRIGGER